MFKLCLWVYRYFLIVKENKLRHSNHSRLWLERDIICNNKNRYGRPQDQINVVLWGGEFCFIVFQLHRKERCLDVLIKD